MVLGIAEAENGVKLALGKAIGNIAGVSSQK
jgi:hypothetical protein